MDFHLRHDITGHALPDEWGTLLATQAHVLETLLTRVAETVTAVNARPDQWEEKTHRLSHLLIQAEQLLTTLAQHYIGLERETAAFQPAGTEVWTLSPESTERLHVIDQVTAALHANLTAARGILADIRARELLS